MSAHHLINLLQTIHEAVADLLDIADSVAPDLARSDPAAVAGAAVLVADARRALVGVEASLTAAAGRVSGPAVGELADGRQYTLSRASDRREWDHDDWQRDTRRAVVDTVLADRHMPATAQMLDAEGELHDLPLAELLHAALAAAQQVHGSTAPRSRELGKLGLHATDYCTTSPAGWRVSAVKPPPP